MTTTPSTSAQGPVACPFCGGPAKMISCMGAWNVNGYEPDGRRIVCAADDCSGVGKPFYGEGMEDAAIAWWNNRQSPAASPASPSGVRIKVEIKEYTPAGGPRVMIWVNDRMIMKDGYCIECVPRHVAPIIVASLASDATPAPTSGSEAERDRFVGLMIGPDPAKVWKEQAYKLAAELDALAKPASEPAGGDVREALKAALERAANAESMLEAWFDLAKKTEAEATPIILDGLKGYLRTSRSGGMPADLSNRVEAVLEDYCGKYLGRALVPVLRGIAALSSSAGPAGENWQDDPTADERWNAGCDFAMTRLCDYLNVDPASVRWDAATETVDGDVSAVIGNIFTARFGEDWSPAGPAVPVAVKPLEWIDDGKHSRADAGFEIRYSVFQRCDGFFDAVLLGTAVGHGYLSAITAKEACQADYEQRIRSALYAHPAPATVEMRRAAAMICMEIVEDRDPANVADMFKAYEDAEHWTLTKCPAGCGRCDVDRAYAQADRIIVALAPATEGKS